jgi:hypothetical protein
MKNIIFCTVFFLMFFSCKKESSLNVTKEKTNKSSIVDNQDLIYKEVFDFRKNSDYNIDNKIKKLDIQYLSLSFKMRYILDRAYISIENEKNILIDWQPFQINFFYDSSFIDAEKEIHLLLRDSDASKGYLIFPGFTEQFSSYFVYYFEKEKLNYIGNYESIDFSKGSFSFNENTKELYISSDKISKYKKTQDIEERFNNTTEDIKLLKENKVISNIEHNTEKIWVGNYSCNFLRIKEESADPRAYGMIYINIDNNGAKFKLDTYKEIIDKDLIVLSCNSTEIVLVEKNNKNSKFTITKNNKKYELKSNLLNDTVGEISVYKLEKK